MIRKAEKKDMGAITKLLLQVHEVHAQGRPDIFKPGGIKYDEAELEKVIEDEKNRPVFVYEEDGEVKGYIFCIYEYQEETTNVRGIRTMYIDDLCVDESCRGQHVGTELYRYAKDVARKEGCYRVTLHVWELNPDAAGFYEHLGMKTLMRTMEEIL
ncbi:MAG: GNAT family N-acetyltransferase [Eubacteriaceae bacterium]|nr:GNAT family N-acetyltransferase [Eubacteriaceae bacterium]MCR4893272.1 GNAT family N-acetyltransferase [Eubacteriales bacterium]